MRFKLDENLPIAAQILLAERGHDAQSVYDEHLAGAADVDVFNAACEETRVLLTLDVDFADARAYRPGSHPGVVVLRLRSQDRDSVVAVLSQFVDREDVDSFGGALVVVTESTVRIRRR